MTHFDDFYESVRDAEALEPLDGLLNGDDVLDPPSADFGYESTPLNALTFATMNVDGVHTAILTENGEVTDESPVVYVSPMDSEDCFVIAASFLDYLAIGCSVPASDMESLLAIAGEDLIETI